MHRDDLKSRTDAFQTPRAMSMSNTLLIGYDRSRRIQLYADQILIDTNKITAVLHRYLTFGPPVFNGD